MFPIIKVSYPQAETPLMRVFQEGMLMNLTNGATLLAWNGTYIPLDSNTRNTRPNTVGPITTFSDVAKPQADPTAERALQETLAKIERAKREWEATVDSLPDLVCLVDRLGRVIRANRTVEAWKLGEVTGIAGCKLHDLVHKGCAEKGAENLGTHASATTHLQVPTPGSTGAADKPYTCHLEAILQQALEQIAQGLPAEYEVQDDLLGRFLLIKAQPMLGRGHNLDCDAAIVFQDITGRKQVEQEREKLIEELDAFAHTVAHDLKNPVGLIMGFAEALATTPTLQNEDRRWCIDAIWRNGNKMNNIIDELLLLAGVRKTQVLMTPLNMGLVVAEARQRLTDMIASCQATLVLPATWPPAMGYAPWVEEVWVNYINNALKYGGQPPRVEMGGEVQPDGTVRFWVRDNGSGLTPEEQANLFTPFTRLDQTRATGHGLGLSIVRRIMGKLGGQAGVESHCIPGQGSIFYFTLPACP